MKLKALTALFLCGVLALTGGLLAFAGEQESPAAVSVPEVSSLPAEAPEETSEEARLGYWFHFFIMDDSIDISPIG